MRNLQKILALVLALVMSLSLMAAAGARDFTDGDQIDETFAESVDVLTGLDVFQGYPTGDFQPKGDITRAEVAAIIYRIATGDVEDTQMGIYADYNKFSDVPSSHWAAGYINYCANAEYIKGRGDGKFYPSDKVTGYEALAMILRVVGYDKNGEFTGADWQVQTAAIANQRKVTQNVSASTLGQPATREMVAELLCQAILINTVNYTLAYGYQISTNDQDTIAYQTFKMEKLVGVVTGNEIADLKNESPMAAGQTRLVVDGNERVLNIVSGLEDIGKSVRVYVRPENGTTRQNLVTAKVYETELNKVYDSFAKVSSVGNSTASSEGITSIEGAEHFINYDYVTRWTARMRITYVMDLKWTQYQAYSMRRDNDGTLYTYRDNTQQPADADKITVVSVKDSTDTTIGTDRSQWKTRLETDGYTYTYVKTITLDSELTQQDWDNLKAIFTDADKTAVNNWLKGEVYVGTASFTAQDDISDDIRWEDFVNTYLKNEETRQQVSSNRLGDRLIIIDNDNDGIAEYVLQTRYTIAKVVPNGSKLTLGAVESKFNDTDDRVNIITASNDLVSVSGKDLAASEEALAVDDVVIYALIDGKIRAQKAETETARITAINRATTTVTYEGGEKKESGVHPHADGLTNGVAGMVIGTNYTMYFDLDGNLAAYTEGNVGSFVLITDGWYNQAVNAREYAVQAFIDGRLQTVNVTNNGSYFIGTDGSNNNWGKLKTAFGAESINNGRTNGNNVKTIVANLEDGNLIPVDKSYKVSQTVRMLDMKDNKIPTRDNNARGTAWATDYVGNDTAYNNNTPAGEYEVLGRSDTVYYYVHNLGGTTTSGQANYVVRTYTGYNNIPAIDPSYIEDVYAVGIAANANNGQIGGQLYYTAEVVVVELNGKYIESRTASEQVFIPATGFVSADIAGAGIETVNMIRGNGEYEEDVLVDMRQSILKGYRAYDEAYSSLNTSTIYAGLYYMDPVGTNADGKVIYKIERMERAAIRSNNYLAGYVSQTNVSNDHVRVDAQTIDDTVTDSHGYHNKIIRDEIIGRDGATITSASKLYKLGYNGSGVPTLNGSLTAAEVFYKDPDPNVSDVAQCYLNELWDGGNLFNNSSSTRNEVLIRYDDNGNMIWAISFNEFRTGSTRDLAQTVWYNMLPAREQVTTPTSFMGIADNGTDEANDTGVSPVINAASGDKRIVITHTQAVESTVSKIVNVTSTSGSVVDYKLERWNSARNNWDLVTRTDAAEAQEAADLRANTGRAVYQLTINLNQGDPIVYTLVKLSARSTTTLEVKKNDGTWSTTGAATGNGYAAEFKGTAAAPTIAVNTEGQTMLINEFISQFRTLTDVRKVEWKFWNNLGQLIPETRWNYDQMINVGYFTVTVIAEDGTTLMYTMDAPRVTPADTTSAVTLPAGVSGTGSITTTPTANTGVTQTYNCGETVTLTAAGKGSFSVTAGTLTNVNYDETTDQTTADFVVPDAATAVITFTAAPAVVLDAFTGVTGTALAAGKRYYPDDTGKVEISFTVTTPTDVLSNVPGVTFSTINATTGACTATIANVTADKHISIVATPALDATTKPGADHRYPYGKAGITISLPDDNNNITITVDSTKLAKFISDCQAKNDTQYEGLRSTAGDSVLVDSSFGSGQVKANECLWAGLQFDAPSTTTYARKKLADGTWSNVSSSLTTGTDGVKTVHQYIKVAEDGYGKGNYQPVPAKTSTKTYEYEFYTSDPATGGTLLKTATYTVSFEIN